MSPSQINRLQAILKHYRSGNIIYPGVLIRQLNLTMKEAYKLLESLLELDILSRCYELHCPHCQKSTGKVYSKLAEAGTEAECEDCGQTIDPMEDSLVVYKVTEQ